MNGVERGFHPWQRLVHRLGQIRPHRQVQLLSVISVAVLGVVVGSVQGALDPTHQSLSRASEQLVPPTRTLDVARRTYAATAAQLERATSPDPTVRADAIAQLTALNSDGEAAWRKYKQAAANLPGERARQRSFEAHRAASTAAGIELVTAPQATPAQLTAVLQRLEAQRADLNGIRGLYDVRIQASLAEASDDLASTEWALWIVAVPSVLVLLLAFGIAARSARARQEHADETDRALHEEANRNELEARLQRSLEMTHNEPAAFDLVRRALSMASADTPAELLIADSSRAHFRQATTTDEHGGPGCPVMTPNDCPAATWGQTQVWPSSAALDACPYLAGRPSGACSAVCVPVSIGGNTVGVVHAAAPDGHPPDESTVVRVEVIARKVGERVGMLRAFERSETQAHTDPLTGLMNRRSLETRVRELADSGHFYVAAYGDLDHFKQLNDVHGHDAGDRALRLFARVLRDTVRPGDLTARYGGEEFVVVLPDCSLDDAYVVVDRIRERLALAHVSGTVPRFTVSFGITASSPDQTFSETLEAADAALLNAKATGRDRVVVSGESGDLESLSNRG